MYKTAIAFSRKKDSYTAGREAANKALFKLGINNSIISKNLDGSPQFPRGILGSISHSKYASVAIASKKETVESIGIDLEELSSGILEFPKHHIYNNQDDISDLSLLEVISIKESARKALNHLSTSFYYNDIALTYNKQDGLIKIRLFSKNLVYCLYNVKLYIKTSNKHILSIVEIYK